MKAGDLIMHRTTGWTALIIRMPRLTTTASMISVWTHCGIGMWRVSRCDVIGKNL